MVRPETFCLLNETRSLASGWDDPSASALWRYNLHYFDDLNAADAAQRATWHRQLLSRWIAENPPGVNTTGWAPYPTSLRMVNWIKWARAGNALPEEALQSLALQARWLGTRLEYHLLGNHLFANAKALVFAGLFFEGPEADRWLRRGLAILRKQLPEQVLGDGGQFELSPMYQALALEDLLDLVNLSRSVGRSVPDAWHDTIGRMRIWLSCMTHPDGEIAFFNDAAIGVAPSPGDLQDYAVRLGYQGLPTPALGGSHLGDSGYVRLSSDTAVALLDVARIGPDYLPGHAHADTLSFELSIRGERCIVNSGTSLYGLGAERLRQRGTAAHNTVTVDGQDSSEVWSGFRVARRAFPVGLRVEEGAGAWTVSCSHDGYRRLKGRPRHFRRWRFSDNQLTVTDAITEGGVHRSVAAFHFHPDLRPVPGSDATEGELLRDGQVVLRWHTGRGRAHIAPATWHPEFGLSLPTNRLLVDLTDNTSEVTFSWA